MTQEEVLLAVAAELDSLGIPYAVTGSMASNAWGHPRFTHDADMLIAPRGVHAERIVETFASDFYISDAAVSEALRRRSMFNLIHLRTSFKVDMWVATPGTFSWKCVERRRTVMLHGHTIYTLSPDDLVLAKLVWHKKTGSQRQFNDAAGVLQVSGTSIDRNYLEQTAQELRVSDSLRRLLRADEKQH